jgi:hypothetical protein
MLKGVDDARNKRPFGPHNRQLHLILLGELHKP